MCGYDVNRSTVPGVHKSLIEATERPQLCVQTDVSLTIYHVDTYTTDNIWCNQRFLKGTPLTFQLQHEMELDGRDMS